MFRDARSYFNSLTRNAEAFSQIASRLKDSIFLTDEELYSVICSHINKEYSVKTPSQLSANKRSTQLARCTLATTPPTSSSEECSGSTCQYWKNYFHSLAV